MWKQRRAGDLVKAINAMRKKEEEAPKKPAEPPPSETYLKEIRDALVNKG